jgi:hypothetical protein
MSFELERERKTFIKLVLRSLHFISSYNKWKQPEAAKQKSPEKKNWEINGSKKHFLKLVSIASFHKLELSCLQQRWSSLRALPGWCGARGAYIVCIKYGKWHGRHEKCSFLRKKIIEGFKPPLQFQETEFKIFRNILDLQKSPSLALKFIYYFCKNQKKS